MAHAAEMVRVLKEKYTNLSFTGHGDALGKVIYSKYYSVFYNFISPSKELCSKMALGEVGLSLPPPGY